MKFTVRIDGADTGFLERLIAIANRKLAARHGHAAAPAPVATSVTETDRAIVPQPSVHEGAP